MKIKSHPFTLPFVKKEQVAKDTFSFYFDRSKENWEFYPGQYIRMMLPQENADERGTMRYFTISSSPLDTQYLRIITKVIQSSFKMTLGSLQAGQEVSFFGPNGIFYLRHEEEPDIVLLAGGIGMTPYISMLEYANEKKLKNNIFLFVAFAKPDEMIFLISLQGLVISREI
jgi:ferredoxin-NADP reductase